MWRTRGPGAHWGARSTLSRFKPAIVIEFWTTGLDRAGSSVDRSRRGDSTPGLQALMPFRDRLMPIIDPPRSEDPQNVFCFHPDRPFTSVKGS